MWEAIGSAASSLITGVSGYFNSKNHMKFLEGQSKDYQEFMDDYTEDRQKFLLQMFVIAALLLAVIGYFVYRYKVNQ
jgi:hypothetical protein